jgi:hypothetical protein
MALIWMVENGCLSEKELARVSGEYKKAKEKK